MRACDRFDSASQFIGLSLFFETIADHTTPAAIVDFAEWCLPKLFQLNE
jgi:hypothetical protein